MLPVLAIMLVAAWFPPLHAEEVMTAQPLQEALKAGENQPTRFVLVSGKTVIGRIVRIDNDVLTIRRPSAGLLVLSPAEIAGVNIKANNGELKRGQLTRLVDGSLGWTADTDADQEILFANTEAKAEVGGPLIRLDGKSLDPSDTSLKETADEEVQAETVAAIPADVDQIGTGTQSDAKSVTSAPIRLLVNAEKASESDKLIYFRLTLSKPPTQSILIIYTLINGTAVAPGDFTHRQGIVVFEPGQTQAVVATTLVNDEVVEGPEDFAFFVTGDPAAVTIANRKVAATILDDDSEDRSNANPSGSGGE